MKKGDIIFVKGKGLLSKLVSFIDGKSDFSHCAIAISNHQVVEANYDTKVAIRHFDETRYSRIEVIPIRASRVEREEIVDTALSYVGRRYDYTQIFGYLFNYIIKKKKKNRFNNPNNLICSELVFLVLEEIGVLSDLNIEDTAFFGGDLTPSQLYDLVMYVYTDNSL